MQLTIYLVRHCRLLWTVSLSLFILTVAIRCALLFGIYSSEIEWRGEVERIAITLAAEGRFANAYVLPAGPTAHNPPGLPFLFSLIFSAAGTGFLGFALKCAMVICCYGALYGLLPHIGMALGLPFEVGALAGLIGALIPFRRTSELYMAWEEPITALFLAVLSIWTLRWAERRYITLFHAVGYGVLWGISFHFAPVLAPVYIAHLLLILYLLRERRSIALRSAVVSLAATILIILPWTVRNRLQMGSWMFMRSNFGLELRVSNNDIVHATSADNNELYDNFHPGFSAERSRELLQMGEVAYHRRMLHQALQWIRSHPRRFLSLTAQRILFYWSGPPKTWTTSLLISLVAIGGFAGLFRLWHDGKAKLCLLFLAIWISFPAVYYLIQINPRYRAPMDWTLLLSAAYLLWVSLGRPVVQGHSSTASPAKPELAAVAGV